MSKTCTRDHAGQMSDEELKGIEELPSSQAGAGRHKCALCAYLLGLQHGEERTIRKVAGQMGIKKR